MEVFDGFVTCRFCPGSSGFGLGGDAKGRLLQPRDNHGSLSPLDSAKCFETVPNLCDVRFL